MSEEKKSPWSATTRDSRNQHRIVLWALVWIGAFLGAGVAISNGWIGTNALAIALTIAVTALGVGFFLAFLRFLNDTDELMRKIQLDALALTVGVGVVFAFSYSLLESAGIASVAEAMTLIMVMTVTYVAGVIVGLRRFG